MEQEADDMEIRANVSRVRIIIECLKGVTLEQRRKKVAEVQYTRCNSKRQRVWQHLEDNRRQLEAVDNESSWKIRVYTQF